MAQVDRFKVALVQLNSELGNVPANLERAVENIARASESGADLVMFPELYLQGYRADERFAATAEPIPGPTIERLLGEARKHGLYVVMGMARLDEGYPHLVYNSLCFVGPEGLIGFYDKIHLGTFHPYIEGVYFAPGQSTPVFDTRLGRVSLQICYDACFPELTRLYAIKGSVVNLVISAGPTAYKDAWHFILRTRSLENLMPSVYCNVVGRQKEFTFFGGSKVVNAAGNVTAEAKFDQEDFLVATVEVAEAIVRRRQTLLFRDRRPDLYTPISAVAAYPRQSASDAADGAPNPATTMGKLAAE